jgi:cell wall-associated NlpC family hydrolase
VNDPRLLPSNGRVACENLRDVVAADSYVIPDIFNVTAPVADLCREPGGARDRQLLAGDAVAVLETRDGWAFLRSEKDGYCGYVASEQLGQSQPATQRICAPSSHLYSRANFKSREIMPLSFASLITVTGFEKNFAVTPAGFLPRQHIAELGTRERSPAQVARLFLGTPYLWGGNSRFGIDCSGLVQTALLACGIECPGDSDLQENVLGRDATGNPRAGDLLFWKGHVAMMADDKMLIHANAHHMAVVIEKLDAALPRIEAQGDGGVTRHARL